jgi:uncharacterized protein (UPF0548 family)
MFFLLKPSPEKIREFYAALDREQLSYSIADPTIGKAPDEFNQDEYEVLLGTGTAAYERAVYAINAWKMFDIPWLELFPPAAPIRVGTNVAILVSHFKFWSLNACRIVSVVDNPEPDRRYGFAYGTLSEHAERGEERFTVEFRAQNQSVWYNIYAFSQPRILPRLAYPFARSLQKQFAHDSMLAMVEATKTSTLQ